MQFGSLREVWKCRTPYRGTVWFPITSRSSPLAPSTLSLIFCNQDTWRLNCTTSILLWENQTVPRYGVRRIILINTYLGIDQNAIIHNLSILSLSCFHPIPYFLQPRHMAIKLYYFHNSLREPNCTVIRSPTFNLISTYLEINRTQKRKCNPWRDNILPGYFIQKKMSPWLSRNAKHGFTVLVFMWRVSGARRWGSAKPISSSTTENVLSYHNTKSVSVSDFTAAKTLTALY